MMFRLILNTGFSHAVEMRNRCLSAPNEVAPALTQLGKLLNNTIVKFEFQATDPKNKAGGDGEGKLRIDKSTAFAMSYLFEALQYPQKLKESGLTQKSCEARINLRKEDGIPIFDEQAEHER